MAHGMAAGSTTAKAVTSAATAAGYADDTVNVAHMAYDREVNGQDITARALLFAAGKAADGISHVRNKGDVDVDTDVDLGKAYNSYVADQKAKGQKALDMDTWSKQVADVDVPKAKGKVGADAATDIASAKTTDVDLTTKGKVTAEAAGAVAGAKVADVDVPTAKVSVDTGTRADDIAVATVENEKTLTRGDYLREKHGTISAEELNQRINLRGETMKQYNEMKEVVKSKRQLGPAFATVYDKTTGKYYSAINNFDGKKPTSLHPF